MKKSGGSINLEVVSIERRSLPRLCLTHELFRLNKNGRVFSIGDLSLNGMAFWLLDRSDVVFFTLGAQIEGVLNLKREKYPVQARVRNLVPDRIGCEFEEISPPLHAALSELLSPEALGRELRPIPSSEFTHLWYHGPSGTDLLLYRGTDGNYMKLMLHVLGYHIQWSFEQGVSTGTARVSGHKSKIVGIVRLETLLLETDSQPDPNKLGIAKTVILSSNLPQDLKGWCVRKLER